MSTSSATVEKPGTAAGAGKQPPRLRHIFCRCDRGQATRVAFCGKTSGPQVGTPYDPRLADPDLCFVCIDLQKQGCVRCKSSK